MKALKITGIVGGAVIILAVVIALFLPTEMNATATRNMDVPPEVVFDLVDNVEKRMLWIPWVAADKTIITKFSDPPNGVGAWYTWTSRDSGSGKMTIVESDPPRLIKSLIVFDEHHEVNGRWDFEAQAEGCVVTWGMHGVSETLGQRWGAVLMVPFMEMAFKEGLKNLEKVAMAAPRTADSAGAQALPDEPAAHDEQKEDAEAVDDPAVPGE